MINYDLSKVKAIVFDVDGVLSAETIVLSHDGEPLRTVNIKDGYAIQLAVKMGVKIAILTGGNTEAVRLRYQHLGVEDIPDYEVMRLCGCPCCPADACADIKNISLYISSRNGGYGWGRDIIEQVLRAKGKWLSDAKA